MGKESYIKKIEVRNELNMRLAKEGNFKAYCLYWDYEFFTRRPILGKVATLLQKVHDAFMEGKPISVAISLPPRAGKSYISSLFCSFMLGRFPTESVMRNSCTSTLYEILSKSVREMVSSDKWMTVWGVELATTGVKSWELKTAKQTSYFGGGVDGTIIGIGATMLAISDDLYKGFSDAMSDVINDKTLQWYDGAADSRKELRCCTIDIGTRWRRTDVIGRNEAEGRYDYVLRIPAMDADGNSFCEDVHTTEQYLRTKELLCRDIVGRAIWAAEYMQEPVDIEGQLFAEDELQYFTLEDIDGLDFDCNIGICDTADEGTDSLSAPMAKKIGDKYYIYDVLFTDEKMEVTEPLLVGALRTNKVQSMRFESNNGGKLFAENVAEHVDTDISWKPTTSNKVTRILIDSSWIKNHCVFRKDYTENSDYAKFMAELFKYQKSGKVTHDDAPDSLSLFRRFTDDLGLNDTYSDGGDDEWESEEINIMQIRL